METSSLSDIQVVYDAIKNVKTCMLTTIDENGNLKCRPMATVRADEASTEIYFFTKDDSEKIDEMKTNQQVNLGYSDHDHQLYVSISGISSISRDHDKIKQLWNPMYRAWFPDGIDDPQLALIRVEPSAAEIWDAPSNKMIQLFGLAKALITGEEYNPGGHQEVIFL